MEANDRSQQMEEESKRLASEIEDTREDWEAKKEDSGVPGAQPEDPGADENDQDVGVESGEEAGEAGQ